MTQGTISRWIPVDASPSPLAPRFCVVDPALALALETTHSDLYETVARRTGVGDEALTRDVPNVAPEKLSNLDEHGLVRVGTMVAPGDILVGRATPRRSRAVSSEEKLLQALFGDRADDLDSSLRVPPGVRGIVTLARREAITATDGDRRELARATVQISWVHVVQPGDVLVDDTGHRAMVVAIRAEGADLRVGNGPRRVAKVAIAADHLHARSIGPYSLVTQRPLEGTVQFGGQVVSTALIAALVGLGNPWAAWELLTLKSDSLRGRTSAYESIVKGDHPAPDAIATWLGAPDDGRRGSHTESVATAERELGALGFMTRLDAAPVVGGWSTSDDVRARSHGRVLNAETIDETTFSPVPGALSCQRIFGPVKDYVCACGKHTRVKDRGVVCDVCGVEVVQSYVRRSRFGHIELPAPVPHPWRLGEVADRLGLSIADVRRVAQGAADLIDSRVVAASATLEHTGGRALAAALGVDASGLLLDAVPVLPADLRPIVRLADGRFAVSDLNDLYGTVWERARELERLTEGHAAPRIVRGELGRLFASIESLFDNATAERPVFLGDRRLRSLRDVIEPRLRTDLITKAVDYSGVAHLIADPDVPTDTCRVPRRMATELFKPWAYGLLEARGFVTTIKAAKQMVESGEPHARAAVADVAAQWRVFLVTADGLAARRIALWDAPAIAVDPATAAALASEEVVVHVPLTAPSLEGARAQGDRVVPLPVPSPVVSGWLSAVHAGSDLPDALRAAASGAPDPIDDPILRAALGLWPDEQAAVIPWLTDAIIGEVAAPQEASAAWEG